MAGRAGLSLLTRSTRSEVVRALAAGSPVGEAVLALRQDFRRAHGNPLGLVYAVHCDADTRIAPALAASAPADHTGSLLASGVSR